jgi:hypothetical protein
MASTFAVAQPQDQRPRPTGVSTKVFIPLLLPFLILIGIGVYAAVTPYASTNLPPPGQRGSLVWGDGIFANEFEFKAWLRLHGGGSFTQWAKLHPAAVKLVKPRKHHAALQAKAKVKRPARIVKAAPAAAVTALPISAKSTKTPSWTRLMFTALGILLALGAVLMPSRYVARIVSGPVRTDRDMRLAIAGAGMAVLGGVAVATLFG